MSESNSELELELSVRSRNIMKHVGATTIRELVRLTEMELLEAKCFGETSLREIKEALAKRGLRLGMTPEQARTHPHIRGKIVAQQMAGSPQSAQESAHEEVCCGHCEANGRKLRQRTEEERLWMSLAELELSVRATNCLEAEGITTVASLTMRSADELLEIRNFGQAQLRELRDRLAQYGLQLVTPHSI